MEATSSLVLKDSFSTSISTRSSKLKQQQQKKNMKKSISNNDISNGEFYSNRQTRQSASNDNSENELNSSNSDFEQSTIKSNDDDEAILKSKSLSFANEIDNIDLYVRLIK